jgi:hypothetical protein
LKGGNRLDFHKDNSFIKNKSKKILDTRYINTRNTNNNNVTYNNNRTEQNKTNSSHNPHSRNHSMNNRPNSSKLNLNLNLNLNISNTQDKKAEESINNYLSKLDITKVNRIISTGAASTNKSTNSKSAVKSLIATSK